MVSKHSENKYDPGFSISYPSRIPDPGVKKEPDPGSGYATLPIMILFLHFLLTVRWYTDLFLKKSFAT